MPNSLENQDAWLAPLTDVAGVVGSFVVGADGRLVAEALPPSFDDADWSTIAAHVHRLQDALCSLGPPLDVCVLDYDEQKLVLRPTPAGLVCVIAQPDVNLPALQMAAHVAARRMRATATLGRAPSPSES
jgi:predicted regulator of Ras-like GTPase activity (Roadblock/LC7/MglB family)